MRRSESPCTCRSSVPVCWEACMPLERLAAGHGVAVLARGRRAAQLRADGLVVRKYGRNCLRARVGVIKSLYSDSSCDHVPVLVRSVS